MDLAKGTPQGSNFGPSLFNVFINDLLYYLPEDSVALYAIHDLPQGLDSKLNLLVNQAQAWYNENGMQSNPTKFQSIFFGKAPKCDILVNNVIIQPTGLIKLLGVSVDAKLMFHTHITDICIKAGRNLNTLKRMAKYLPFKVKLQLYNTYISCHFNFCPRVWHFCSQSDTDKLELLQYRALWFVYDDSESDYDSLHSRENMPNLELSRQRQLCTQVFKCINNQSPQYLS